MNRVAPVRVLVAGHDWGGINLLVPLLRRWRDDGRIAPEVVASPTLRRDISQLVRGQAVAPDLDAFDDWLSSNPLELERFLAGVLARGRYDLVLCSTSAHAPLERRLFRAARTAGVPSIAFCDMWWAYAERFRDAGEWFLPDRLWVVDERMRAAAASVEWPAPLQIEVVGSPLFGELASRRGTGASRDDGTIRFVSEPVSTKYPEARIDEFALAEMVVDVAREIGLATSVVIRPHPVDSQETWRRWIFARRARGVMLETLPVEEAIADTAMAVGISSILLAEMRMCGIPTASLQLPNTDSAYYCLPFEAMGITRLATREALGHWLRAPRVSDTPVAQDLHVGSAERITELILVMPRRHSPPGTVGA
jgi:hypothetical protein